MQIFFKDGTHTNKVTVEYPIGHRRRRDEGKPVLFDKFKANLATQFTAEKVDMIFDIMTDKPKLMAMPVTDFMALWC